MRFLDSRPCRPRPSPLSPRGIAFPSVLTAALPAAAAAVMRNTTPLRYGDGAGKGEGGRERETERDREREIEINRDRDRHREREIESDRDRDRQRGGGGKWDG